MYIYTLIYTYTHIHIHIYIYIYIHICTYIYLRAWPRAAPWALGRCGTQALQRPRAQGPARGRALRYTYVHICMYMYMYIYRYMAFFSEKNDVPDIFMPCVCVMHCRRRFFFGKNGVPWFFVTCNSPVEVFLCAAGAFSPGKQ